MSTREPDAALPLAQQLKRLAHTPDDVGAAVRGRGDVELALRPDAKHWSAKWKRDGHNLTRRPRPTLPQRALPDDVADDERSQALDVL